jgi:hypothetical protein
MLTLFQLHHLPLNEQAQYVLDNGDFYATNIEKEQSINLYSLGNLSAEVIYNEETNTIVEVRFKESNVTDL